MASAWVIRSGRHGERDQWALANGFSGGGWHEVPDLSDCRSRRDVGKVVEATWPNASSGKRHNTTGQLWSLRARILPGDLLVMPLKATKQFALGRVVGGYRYRAEEPEPDRRHVVQVDWERIDLPRSVVGQDLLNTLGSAISIFSPSKNSAVTRLEHMLRCGTDPGDPDEGKQSRLPSPASLGVRRQGPAPLVRGLPRVPTRYP